MSGKKTTQSGKKTTQSGKKTTQSAQKATQSAQKATQSAQKATQSDEKTTQLSNIEASILDLIRKNSRISQKELSEILSCNYNTLKYYITRLKEKGYLAREGTSRKGIWVILK